MAVSINIRAVDNYSRQLNDTRRSINNINTSIAQNRRAALTASEGTKNVLNASNRLLSAEKRLLTAKSASITLEKRLATEAERARQKIIRETEKAERASRKFAGALRVVQGNLVAVASTSILFGLTDLARSFVETGNEIEGAVNAFDALGESGQAVTKYLIDVARASDGITFEGLNVAVQRFRAAGASIEEATGFATGFGKQLALLNVSVADQTNFMRQLTQAYAGNNAEGDDLRTLFEVMPQLSDLSTRALGYQVQGWKTLRPAIEAAGVSVREWVALTSEIAASQGTIDTDRFVIQFERLTETFRDIQREVGQRLLPVLSQGAKTTNNFLQTFAESPGKVAAFTAGTLAASAIVVKFATGIRLALVPLNTMTVQMPLAAAASQGLSFSITSLTARLAAGAAGIKAYAAALATMSISTSAAIPIIGAFTLAAGAIAVSMRNARAEASEFDSIMAKIAGADFGRTGVRRTNIFAGVPIGEIRTEIATLRTGLENASNELSELESRFSGAARAHLGAEINQRIESLSAAIKNYTRNLDEAQSEIFSRPLNLAGRESLEQEIAKYQQSLQQNDRTLRHIYGNIANTMRVGIDEVDKIVAENPKRLRDAVDSAILKRIQTLQEAQAEIQKLIDAVNLEITTRPVAQQGDTDASNVFNQIGITALKAADRVERARDRIRNAESVGEATAAAAELTRALQRQRAIQEGQAREQAETAEEFALKRTEIRLRTARAIEGVEQTHANKILSIVSKEKRERERIEAEADRQQKARIQDAARRRRLEIQAYREILKPIVNYAKAIQNLNSVASRQRFGELVENFRAQGDSLDQAIVKANQFRSILDGLPGPAGRLSRSVGSLGDDLEFKNRQLELGTRQFAQYGLAIQATANAVSELLKPLRELDERLERTQSAVELREEEVFTAPQQGPNLDTLRQEAGEEGRKFVNRLLKRQERELDASLKRQYQQYKRFYNRVADLGIDALFGRISSVREFVTSLAEEFLRGIVRVEIAERVANARRIALEQATAAQRLNIDNALTNAKIANIQRLQQAQHAANSQIGNGGIPGASAINQTAGLLNLNIPGLSQFSNLLNSINVGNLATGGAGALSVAGLLFPNELKNLSTGIGEEISEGFSRFTDFLGSLSLEFPDGASRKITARSSQSRRGRIHAQ